MTHRYKGRVVDVSSDGRYGFIDIYTIEKESPHAEILVTKADIFVHLDDFVDSIPQALRNDMELVFGVVVDEKRGAHHYRALVARETSESRLVSLSHGGIELTVRGMGKDGTVEHPSTFINWCLSEALVEEVGNRLVSHSQQTKLLIIWWPTGEDAHSSQSEERMLVDLADSRRTGIISFDRPGTFRVLAVLVCDYEGYKLNDEYLAHSRRKNGYTTDIVSSDGCGTIGVLPTGVNDGSSGIFGSGALEVKVPEALFSRKPLDWNWVNWFFENDPKDQCAYRWRRVFAYTLQAPLFATLAVCVWMLSALVVLGLLSVGMRNINYDPVVRPWDYPAPSWAWYDLNGSVFIPYFKGVPIFIPFAVSPMLLTACAAFTWIASADPSVDWLLYSASCMGLMITTCTVMTLVSGVSKVLRDRSAASKEKAKERARQHELDELGALVCVQGNATHTDDRLPPLSIGTVNLHYTALKQKVCRPFAR